MIQSQKLLISCWLFGSDAGNSWACHFNLDSHRQAHLDDGSSSLLHNLDELIVQVLIIPNHLPDRLPLHSAMVHIRVLWAAVVAPDDHILDICHCYLGLLCYLTQGSVVVQACEAGDVLVGDLGCVLLEDKGVCVGRVGNHNHLEEQGVRVNTERKKRQEKTMPFGISLVRSPVLYWAAQAQSIYCRAYQGANALIWPRPCCGAGPWSRLGVFWGLQRSWGLRDMSGLQWKPRSEISLGSSGDKQAWQKCCDSTWGWVRACWQGSDQHLAVDLVDPASTMVQSEHYALSDMLTRRRDHCPHHLQNGYSRVLLQCRTPQQMLGARLLCSACFTSMRHA